MGFGPPPLRKRALRGPFPITGRTAYAGQIVDYGALTARQNHPRIDVFGRRNAGGARRGDNFGRCSYAER